MVIPTAILSVERMSCPNVPFTIEISSSDSRHTDSLNNQISQNFVCMEIHKARLQLYVKLVKGPNSN